MAFEMARIHEMIYSKDEEWQGGSLASSPGLSGSSSPSLPSPRSLRASPWALTSEPSLYHESSPSFSEEELDSDSDAGAEIAEWMANACTMEESEEPAALSMAPSCAPPGSRTEKLSVRTMVTWPSQPSPWLGALKREGAGAPARGEASDSSQESSQEGSPTSVLGQAGSQAWELLFAAAGEVQKLARGQGEQGPQQPITSFHGGGADKPVWVSSAAAASMGLTAGAAAPVVLPVVNKAVQQLPPAVVKATGKVGVPPGPRPANTGRPGQAPRAEPFRPHAPSPFPTSARGPPGPKMLPPPNHSRPYPGPSPYHCGPPRPGPSMHGPPHPPHLRMAHGQAPPPFGSFLNQLPPRAGPMGPMAGHHCIEQAFHRPPPFQGPGLRGAVPEEPLHAVVLGYGKDPISGTGVFLPRGGAPQPGSQGGEEGSGVSHSTTVLLPARLIQSLGLNINSENSVVVNRPMGLQQQQQQQQLQRAGLSQCVPMGGQGGGPRRPMGAPGHGLPVGPMGGPRQGEGGATPRPRFIPPGLHSIPPNSTFHQRQHRWGPPPANLSRPCARDPPSPAPNPAYANLPSEWAY